MEQASIIVRPIITEKSMDEAGRGRFTFIVSPGATKMEVKKMVEEQFKVHVVSVHTLLVKGKRGKTGKRRTKVLFSPAKKAIVALKEGEKIDLFAVEEKKK